ncbi:hypothetical protein UES1_325 [Escherichia phage UE-S1]|nr:hypothetical protein UES1_325 [Escherichia phage UE-S1]
MSLASALKLAHKIHHFHDNIKSGFYGDKVHTYGNEYYLSGVTRYSNDILLMGCDKDNFMQYTSCSLYTNFIVYMPGANITFDTSNTSVDFGILDGPWGTEEYYFQQSFIFSQEMLDSLVVLWYFKELDIEPFFMDWGACEYLETEVY